MKHSIYSFRNNVMICIPVTKLLMQASTLLALFNLYQFDFWTCVHLSHPHGARVCPALSQGNTCWYKSALGPRCFWVFAV